jgi:hypothetical protein
VKVLRPLFIAILFLSLFACSGQLSKKQQAEIRTVAIVNNFPDYPAYAQINISIHTQAYPTVNEPAFKRALTNQVAQLVRQQGYLVKENFDGDASKVDLLIEISPEKVDDLVDSFAYGFHYRSLLGLISASHSYVSLNLMTKLKGKTQCDDCVGESVTKLDIHGWRNNWIELPRTEKKKFEDALNSNIKNAVETAFSKTGL